MNTSVTAQLGSSGAQGEPMTLCGQIAQVYGKLDAEDCKFVDREWARMRGYILPTDGTSTLLSGQNTADEVERLWQYFCGIEEGFKANGASSDRLDTIQFAIGAVRDTLTLLRAETSNPSPGATEQVQWWENQCADLMRKNEDLTARVEQLTHTLKIAQAEEPEISSVSSTESQDG